MTYTEVAQMIKQAGPRPSEKPSAPPIVPQGQSKPPQGQPMATAPVTTTSPQSKPVNNASKTTPDSKLPTWAQYGLLGISGIKGLLDKFTGPNYYAEKPKRAVTPLAMDPNIMNRTLY